MKRKYVQLLVIVALIMIAILVVATAPLLPPAPEGLWR